MVWESHAGETKGSRGQKTYLQFCTFLLRFVMNIRKLLKVPSLMYSIRLSFKNNTGIEFQ